MMPFRKFAVGSQNKAKLRAAETVLTQVFGADIIVEGVNAPSDVDAQPMDRETTERGAINRAKAALSMVEGAELGIGMEGGIEHCGERFFESGWIAVVDRTGRVGLGTSARLELSKKIVDQIRPGHELGDVIDEMTGETDVRSSQGVMGILTLGHLPRDLCYTHGLLFALAPFISDQKYW